MLPYRKHGSEELARGYATAARLAEERQRHCEEAGDHAEAKQWGKVARYCSTMAKYRLLDEPNPRVNYGYPKEIPMDPLEIQRRIASEVKWESDLDLDTDDSVDPRRPIERWKRMALVAAMRTLSPTERVVAQMYFGWRLPKDLIGEALEVELSAVEQYLKRVRQKFVKIEREA